MQRKSRRLALVGKERWKGLARGREKGWEEFAVGEEDILLEIDTGGRGRRKG